MKKRFFSVMLVLICVFGITISASAATQWAVYVTPTQLNKKFEKGWEVKGKNIKFNCDGMEYYCMATIGYDTWWTDEDYIDDVGGVSAGMKCGGKVYNSRGDVGKTGWIKAAKLSGYVWVRHYDSKNVKYKFTVAVE